MGLVGLSVGNACSIHISIGLADTEKRRREISKLKKERCTHCEACIDVHTHTQKLLYIYKWQSVGCAMSAVMCYSFTGIDWFCRELSYRRKHRTHHYCHLKRRRGNGSCVYALVFLKKISVGSWLTAWGKSSLSYQPKVGFKNIVKSQHFHSVCCATVFISAVSVLMKTVSQCIVEPLAFDCEAEFKLVKKESLLSCVPRMTHVPVCVKTCVQSLVHTRM